MEALANPDSSKYEIYYGVNITPTDSGVTLDTESFLPAASIADWSAVNCIKIMNKTGVAIAEGESADFVMKCTVDTWDANIDQTTNIVAAKYHQDLTVDGSTYTGWYNGNPTAIEICCGVIEGDVYLDINKNGKLDAIDQIDQKTNIYNGAKVQLYRVGYTHAPMQETTVVDGHYRFADLLRGSGAYEIVIIRPDGVAEKYQLSMQNTIIENDGATHHLFANDSVDSKKAVATNLWAVQKPGNRDNGITEGGNGIYNLLLQNVEHGELRVEKKVKGDLAQTDKEFEFAVKIYSDAAGTILATGDCHYQVYNQDGKENGDPASITNGQGVIKLKHGQYFILCKLPDGYYVRVIETNAGGYQTSIVTQNGTTDTKQNIPADNKTPGNLQISKTKAGDSTLANRVDYTNSRVSPVITGVNMDMGIWLLLAGIIIALLAIVIGGRCHTHRRHRRYGN